MPHALIIDDNLQNVKVLAQLLAKQGVKCTEILNPTQIIDNPVQDESIDVIFLDLEMPTIDGYQLKDMLRAYLGDVPIIAYTVHVSEMNVVRDMGFDGFLGKPLDTTKFPNQLARILRGEAVWERA